MSLLPSTLTSLLPSTTKLPPALSAPQLSLMSPELMRCSIKEGCVRSGQATCNLINWLRLPELVLNLCFSLMLYELLLACCKSRNCHSTFHKWSTVKSCQGHGAVEVPGEKFIISLDGFQILHRHVITIPNMVTWLTGRINS